MASAQNFLGVLCRSESNAHQSTSQLSCCSSERIEFHLDRLKELTPFCDLPRTCMLSLTILHKIDFLKSTGSIDPKLELDESKAMMQALNGLEQRSGEEEMHA